MEALIRNCRARGQTPEWDRLEEYFALFSMEEWGQKLRTIHDANE